MMIMKLYRDEEILACWLRDLVGMNYEQIMEEVERLRKCNHVDDYIRMKRIGATFRLDRQKRKYIWGLATNAIRHEQIEKEMKKEGAL